MSAKMNKQLSTHAVIRENALIIYLDKPETPVVARFDLDSLAQANFVIQPEGNMHRLNMRDFSGNTQTIAEFSNKIDAHQALNHILQALVNHKLPKEITATSSKAATIFGIVLKVLGIAFIALCLYLAYSYMRMHQPAPAAIQQETSSSMDGAPQDLEELFPSTSAAER